MPGQKYTSSVKQLVSYTIQSYFREQLKAIAQNQYPNTCAELLKFAYDVIAYSD
jgi:hypothetical protein